MTYLCVSCDRPFDSKAAADECARVDAQEDADNRIRKSIN